MNYEELGEYINSLDHKEAMMLVCRICGKRYGSHIGWNCPPSSGIDGLFEPAEAYGLKEDDPNTLFKKKRGGI